MLNFCDFIQVFVFTRNHHLNLLKSATSNKNNENDNKIIIKARFPFVDWAVLISGLTFDEYIF